MPTNVFLPDALLRTAAETRARMAKERMAIVVVLLNGEERMYSWS